MFKHFKIPAVYQIVFWISYFVFNVVRWGSYFNNYWYSLKSNLVEFPLHILLTYFTIYYLIPKFIPEKKYIQFFFYFLCLLVIIYFVRTELIYFLVSKDIWPEAQGIQKPYTLNHFVAVAIGEVYVVALVSAIKLTVDWVAEKKKNAQLVELQNQTELKFLKSQIQPHFFFNTLNSLYALTLTKSDLAPEVVVKLSDMMQYVIYEIKDQKVDLIKEINHIQNYIELEQLRHGNRIKTDLKIEGDLSGIEVPPLILLTFVENCFKHSAPNSKKINIKINFVRKENFIWLTLSNPVDENETQIPITGIGLKNVRRRLDLVYGNRYELTTKNENEKFIVSLKLPVR